jgi:hypothetical protein
MIRCLLVIGLATGWMAAVSCAAAAETVSQVIDRLVGAALAKDKIQLAGLADDAEFVRRIYLDLVGRIPTREEAERFVNDRSTAKRARLIDSLLASGEFAQHWRENLNALLMGGPAFGGNPEWRAWLETSLRANRKWDDLARAMLRARPAKPEEAGASQFLLARLTQGDSGLDLATRDVSRFFFGVDIQCARCHRHPEVDQWKQESYWGMAAYFVRSYPVAVQGKTFLAERAVGEVNYTPKGKPPRTAPPTFLTGEKLSEPARNKPAPKPPAPAEDPADYLVAPEAAPQKTRVPVPRFSRREKLVEVAINSKSPYFKRAVVNYLWAQLLGRGLVEPVDQMHEGNPPSHPELLNYLADDLAAHQFDLRYLIRSVCNSQTYQRSSRYPANLPRPAEATYAVGAVRPLSLHQLANSLMVAAGYFETFKMAVDAKTRADPSALRARFEGQYLGRLSSLVTNLDSGGEPYQPGVREALFQANSPEFAGFVAVGGLGKRLALLKDDAALVREAYLCTLSRLPAREEEERMRQYLRARPDRRAVACEQLVWALITSSEFRFNH